MKKTFSEYGLYIPAVLVVIFTISDLLSAGSGNWAHQVLYNVLVYGLGAQSIGFAVVHLFYADMIAENIGWPKGSPFQYEVAVANLVVGVLGILCAWFSGSFWVATVIAGTIWYWGCAFGHIRDMVRHKNFAPGSAGYVFYFDVFCPLVLIVLFIIKQ